MADDKYLWETLPEKAFKLRLQYPEIPEYITDNLRYELFTWQEEALINFLTYEQVKEVEEDINPSHLLFNMATGTGKTLLMALNLILLQARASPFYLFR